MSRFRSLPMAPMSILSARALADMLRGVLEVALLLGVGLLMGWRTEALAAVGVLLLFRLSLVWLGMFMGLALPNADPASMVVHPLAFPLTMVSTSFIPARATPSWMAPTAEWNPLSAVVTGTRELFGNPALPSILLARRERPVPGRGRPLCSDRPGHALGRATLPSAQPLIRATTPVLTDAVPRTGGTSSRHSDHTKEDPRQLPRRPPGPRRAGTSPGRVTPNPPEMGKDGPSGAGGDCDNSSR